MMHERRNDYRKLEKLVEENSNSLERIMSPRIPTLIDTNTLLHIGKGFDNIIDILRGDCIFNDHWIKFFEYYNNYIKIIFNNVQENNNNFTAPEIIEEMEVVKQILLDKFKGATRHIKKQHIIGGDESKLNFTKEIINSFKGIKNIFSDRLFDNDLIFNRNHEKIYGTYKRIINEAYNLFVSSRMDREEICPDDGLIATAIILLQRNEKPIRIISNDKGVAYRIRIFNSLLYHLEEEKVTSNRIKKLSHLFDAKGISLYNFLNKEGKYKLYGATFNKGMKYHLKYERGNSYLKRDSKLRFRNTEWKRHLSHFKNLFGMVDYLEGKYGNIT